MRALRPTSLALDCYSLCARLRQPTISPTPSREGECEFLVDPAEDEDDDEVDDGRRDAGDRRRL